MTAHTIDHAGPLDALPEDAAADPPRRARWGRWGVLRFVAPAALALLVLQIYPLARGLWLSMTDTSLLTPKAGEYIGLANFRELWSDGQLTDLIVKTLIYTVGSVVGSVGLGLLSATAMNRSFRGRALVRSILTIPWAAPGVATALVFIWIYDAQYGVLNFVVTNLNLFADDQRWLSNPDLSMPSVVAATVWKVFPFCALVLLAAMQSIEPDLYEAARVDRASAFNRFRRITIPAISPSLLVLTLFVTIWSFRRFELIWIMTGGGPVGSTNVMVVDLYRESFPNRRLGYGAAIGVVGLVMSTIATVLYFSVARKVDRQHGR